VSFQEFIRWLQEEELAARPDAARVADDLSRVVGRIVDAAGDLEGGRVLDVGVGAGAVSFAAADRGALVTGLDTSADDLGKAGAIARSSGAAVRLVVGDARSMPFGDGAFDVSLHRSVLVYLADAGRAVAEERRVLSPGGRVSCSESLGAASELQSQDPGTARVWMGLRTVLEEAGSTAYAFSGDALVALYRNAGFTEVRLQPLDHGIALDSPEAIARLFQARPGAGLSAREYWERAGVPAAYLDEFLARLVLEAEDSRPARFIAPQGLLTASAPA
jgi:ubiquinone/menaquinone biosynthesis C-methylase UbiE